MKVGAFEIYPLSDGRFRLDGGAMFGVVPKVLWEKCCPADDLNRIPLSLTTLLIRAHGKNILVDTGLGPKEDEKFHRMLTGARSVELEDDELGKLVVFSGVKEFPVRVKCATLAWHTLNAALKHQTEPASTE